jgi:hypothetical protein
VPLVSMRAYARHRGVSLKAVQKALGSGRIEKTAAALIDVELADANWARRTAPRPLAAKPSLNDEQAADEGPEVPHERTRDDTQRIPRSRADVPLGSGADYSRARAIRENYLARMAKLDFEERSGKLMSRDEVKVAAFNRFRTFRDAMLNIPDRLAALVAAETDPVRVHDLLTTEIRNALMEVSDANG